jgi:hypothetical protein
MSAIPYTVRRSTRARLVRVDVHPDASVEVVLPTRAPERAAHAAVVELQPWIERRVSAALRVRAGARGPAGTIPYLGGALTLVTEPRRQRVHRVEDVLLVPASGTLAAVERWYRTMARREVGARLDRAAAIAGTPYRDLTIRGQARRWASCTSPGRMSFNWKLLLAPAPVLDYVVWHEICHLQVMDHSARFWALVESHWPSYPEQRAWLSRHGATLDLALHLQPSTAS